MFIPFVVLALPYFITSAQALNDWTVPCFGGECSYDLPTSSQSSGSLKIVRTLLFSDSVNLIRPSNSGVLQTQSRMSPRPLAGLF